MMRLFIPYSVSLIYLFFYYYFYSIPCTNRGFKQTFSTSASLQPQKKLFQQLSCIKFTLCILYRYTVFVFWGKSECAPIVVHTHACVRTHTHTNQHSKRRRELHWHLSSDIFEMTFCLLLNPHSLSMNPILLSYKFIKASFNFSIACVLLHILKLHKLLQLRTEGCPVGTFKLRYCCNIMFFCLKSA